MRSSIYKILQLLAGSTNAEALRVLAYHTVPISSVFEEQVSYLKQHYNIISVKELQDALYNSKKLPLNSLLITFDDGDISVYENGFPVLKKLKVPSAMFVITHLIDTNKTFWCRWVEKVFENEGKTYGEAREKVDYLKKVPERDRRDYLSQIPEIHSVQLSSNQIRELQDNQMFIGNHTHTHPMINNCNRKEIQQELSKAESVFKDIGLPENYKVFAYPNGNWEPKSEKILMEEGISMAFLFDHQINKDIAKINPMRISRIRVNADDDLSEFKVKVTGLHSKILNLRKKLEFKTSG